MHKFTNFLTLIVSQMMLLNLFHLNLTQGYKVSFQVAQPYARPTFFRR